MKLYNKDFFKNSKIKLFTIATVLSVGLAGCGITANNNTNQENYDSTSYNVENEKYYPLEIQYKNWNENDVKEEVVSFANQDGVIYNIIVGIQPDGFFETYTNDEIKRVCSHSLQTIIDLPETDEEHKIILTIDYQEKTMDTEVVELSKTK